ncbi:hypothetical protein [Zhihengliuella flava]|uniref:Membrane protein n=1 Tax=Zhihengliuella flava TaxID=1285193 RepID=A0A931GFH2_9MICC|nr:hypothetical protein [Zhihengliuella flava]MBG6085235.1 putative membrane protein [Zhihengliuella flava]
MNKRTVAPSPSRWVMIAAAAVAIISVLAIVIILALYATGGPELTILYWVGLYGLPLAFALLVIGVLLHVRARRRG